MSQRYPQQYRMGQKQLSEFENSQNWSIEDVSPERTLIKNSLSRELLELHFQTCPDEEQHNLQSEIWKKRTRAGDNVVKTLANHRQNSNAFCSKSVMSKVYTQHLQRRLDTLNSLSQSDSVWVLNESLKGFEEIKKNHNCLFPVSGKNIGFTPNNEVKVWLNSKLAQNKPAQDLSRAGPAAQHLMCQSIVNTVKSSSKTGKFSDMFTSYLNKVPQPYRLADLQARTAQYLQATQGPAKPQLQSLTPVAKILQKSPQIKEGVKGLLMNLYSGPGSKV